MDIVMDKKFKKPRKFIKVILIIWIIFILVDCIRLRFSEFNTTPMITLSDVDSFEENELIDKYYNKEAIGLGYTIFYTTYNFEDSIEKQRDFKIFGVIPVWSQKITY